MVLIHSLTNQLCSINIFTEHLFKVQKPRNLYYIEINPVKVSRISYVNEGSRYLKGEEAYYGHCTGIWDLIAYPFGQNVVSLLAKDIYENKISSSKTYFYIKSRYSKEKANLQVEKLEKLFLKFSKGTYLSQYEMGNMDKCFNIGPYNLPRHELIVALSRKGEFIRIIGGKHRLAVAQILNLPKIPAILTITHPDAVDFLPERCRIIKGHEEDFKPFN